MLDILKMGHPSLRKKSLPVENFQDSLVTETCEHLLQAADRFGPIVGVAAPQIDVSLRIFVFHIPAHKHSDKIAIPYTIAINPEYRMIDDTIVEDWEASMSLPHVMGQVPRYKRIEYHYYDQNGCFQTNIAENFHARVIQHQCDVLDGILYIERIKDFAKFGYMQEIRQYLMR